MAKKPLTYIHWPLSGQVPANLPPQTHIRRVEGGLGFAFAAGILAAALALWLVWRPLPSLPLAPGPLALHIKAWACLALHLAGTETQAATRYLTWAQQVPWPIAWGRPTAAALIALGCAWAGWRAGFKPRPLERVLEGAEVHQGDKRAQAAMQQKLGRDGEETPWLRIAPDLKIPLRTACQHFIIGGGTGCGKTTFIWPIYQRLLGKHDTRSFCFDPKGDFTRGTTDAQATLIAPGDARSAVWDIARDINTEDRARAFAESVVNSGRGKGDNGYFAEASIAILTGIVVSLQKCYGEVWGWGELQQLVAMEPAALRKVLEQHCLEAIFALPGGEEGEASKQAELNYSSFRASFQPLLPMCKAWATPTEATQHFALRQWLKADYTGPRHIVLQPMEGERGGYYIGAMLAAAARIIINPAFKKLPGGVAFVLDELPAMGKVEALGKGGLIDKSRSLNCCLFLGFQSVNQLRELYGREAADAFLAMVPNVFLGRTQGGEDAKYWVQAIGKQRVQKTTTSHHTRGTDISASYGVEERDAIMAKDLAELGARDTLQEPGWGIEALLMLGGEVMRITFPGYEAKERRPANVPAEWTKAESEKNQEKAHADLA